MVSDAQMRVASRNLTRFVIGAAARIKSATGIGYEETNDAPSTFDALKAAYAHSKRTLAPLPVWSGGSENTIYASKEGNWAFRFWHDMTHCANGWGFSLSDEVKVAEQQAQAIAHEFGSDSLEYRMFLADTVGQSLYTTMNGGTFPADQWAFVRDMLNAEQPVMSAAA